MIQLIYIYIYIYTYIYILTLTLVKKIYLTFTNKANNQKHIIVIREHILVRITKPEREDILCFSGACYDQEFCLK